MFVPKVPARPRRGRLTAVAASALSGPIVLFGLSAVQAQQAAAPATTLPEIVVSATGTETPANQIASSVTVITGKELERDQRRTASDALATVPGLNVVDTGGPGGVTGIYMRGTNNGQTKILVDGIDVSDPTDPNRVFNLSELLTSDIERIEVLRGPQSGLYGADAIGGVISIITKKGEGPPRATASVEGGSFGTFNQNAGLSGSQDRINYAFNVSHFQATNIPVTPQELLPPGQKANGNAYDNMTYSTRIGADVTDNFSVNVVARFTDGTLHYTGDTFNPATFKLVPSATQSTQLTQQIYTRSEVVWSLFDGRFKNYFGVNYTNVWNSFTDPGATPSINTGERVKYDWRGVANLMPGETLVLGAEHETETLDSTVHAENANKAAYIELQSEYAKRLFLVSNFRVDDNERFGEHSTYRIAPAVILPGTETKLKASYGTGFKAPTLSQLFVDFPSFFFVANPNLKPEESRGYDAGFEQPLFDDRVRFGSTYFHNDIANLINLNDTVTSYTNVGQATTEGTENFVSATVNDRLKLRADYTFTRAVDTTTGLQLQRRPKEKWSTTATWTPLDPLTLSATLLHVSSWLDVSRDTTVVNLTAPGYTIVNLAANYVVNDQVKVFGRIDNLFNLHYQNPTGFLQTGFGIFGGIRVASYGVNQ